MLPKILFLKFGKFSKINNEVYRFLENGYPGYQIKTIDILEIIKHKTEFYHFFINIFYFINEYGIELISGYKKWNKWEEWFFATSYISNLIAKKVKKMCKGEDYKFTLQTQSLFNGKLDTYNSVPYSE